MKLIKAVLIFAFIVFVQSALGQKELTPEPGALAEVDSYDLKLREAFSEAYGQGVDLRAIFLPSFATEIALYINEKNIVTLAPKKKSIWSHEHRELVRKGSIKRTDINGHEIPPEKENAAEKKIPENIKDIEIFKRSRPLDEALLRAVFEVWEDALIHATYQQEPRSVLDGARWHYSSWIRGRGVLSGTVRSPEGDTIPVALNEVCGTLIKYAAHEANESQVASALWKYKIATKARSDGMAAISIEKPPKEIPISNSVNITRETILQKFSADNVSLKIALEQLTAESAKWGKTLGYDGINFVADQELENVKVTYNAEHESMKFICEALAEQAGADLHFKDWKIELLKKPAKIVQTDDGLPLNGPETDSEGGDKPQPEPEVLPR